MRRINTRRISLVVNSTLNNRKSDNQQVPPGSTRGWIFALILCCLPGLSLVDAAVTALTTETSPAASATPLNLQHSPNTQVAVSSRDSALTSTQRLLSHAKRAGGTCINPHTDNADSFDSPAVAGAHPSAGDLHPPVRGQGYDTDKLCLATPPARTPYSPRSPPSLA